MKAKKKAIVVDVWQYRETLPRGNRSGNISVTKLDELPDFIVEALSNGTLNNHPNYFGDVWMISTPEGNMRLTDKDFIIKGVAGEIYPCKEGIFLETYDLETDGAFLNTTNESGFSDNDRRSLNLYNVLQSLFSDFNIDCCDNDQLLEILEEIDGAAGTETANIFYDEHELGEEDED